jgi:hypothetical protein
MPFGKSENLVILRENVKLGLYKENLLVKATMRDASLQKKKSNQKEKVMNEVPIIMLLMFFLWPALPIFSVACKLLYQLGEL